MLYENGSLDVILSAHDTPHASASWAHAAGGISTSARNLMAITPVTRPSVLPHHLYSNAMEMRSQGQVSAKPRSYLGGIQMMNIEAISEASRRSNVDMTNSNRVNEQVVENESQPRPGPPNGQSALLITNNHSANRNMGHKSAVSPTGHTYTPHFIWNFR